MLLPESRFAGWSCRIGLAVVLSAGLLASACQFRPLYGTAPAERSIAADLSTVDISRSGGRLVQLIRNRLISTMSPPGKVGVPRYRLELDPVEKTSSVFVRSNTEVDRLSYKLSVKYSLYDVGGRRIVHTGGTFSIVSYDRVDSEFANVRAYKDAREKAAVTVADDIRKDIASKLTTL